MKCVFFMENGTKKMGIAHWEPAVQRLQGDEHDHVYLIVERCDDGSLKFLDIEHDIVTMAPMPLEEFVANGMLLLENCYCANDLNDDQDTAKSEESSDSRIIVNAATIASIIPAQRQVDGKTVEMSIIKIAGDASPYIFVNNNISEIWAMLKIWRDKSTK